MGGRLRSCWRKLRLKIKKVGDVEDMALCQLTLASCECAGRDDCVCS
jgi:hypothetical protein